MTNIKLNLTHHCVETEIKRLYNQKISQYFKPDADKEELEKKIEILKRLLESCDFAYLRNTHKILQGHSDVDATINVNKNGEIRIICNSKIINL